MRITESRLKEIRTKQVARLPKYGNKKTVVDGVTFDSKKESQRYHELKLMLKAGVITDLELQPKYEIAINLQKICTYIADFRYRVPRTGISAFWNDEEKYKGYRTVVEDVKGMKTPVYNLKKKLMKAVHGIEITEI